MGLLDKAKNAAEQAAAKAREGVEDVQARKDLHDAYVALGKQTTELVAAGAIEHEALAPLVARVHELKAKLGDGAAAAEPEPESAGPPAMPL